MEKKRKVRKMLPYTPKWYKMALEERLGFAPSEDKVAPCIDCGYPVIMGYCCNRCGSGW